MAKKPDKKKKDVEAFTHKEASRKNIPTAEFEFVMAISESRYPIGLTGGDRAN